MAHEIETSKADDLTAASEQESTSRDYLAWKKAKIEAALQEADAHPNASLTLDEVWRKHGLGG